ncbi:MAG: hypothetical protein R3266_10130, partial [Gemmatimonadota bacterium]|nr:hypothetical protein [Gemmatimonadota bacterium]
RDLGPGGFRDWATRPREEGGGLSYFLQEIYAARIDLQEAFPDVRGRDREAFIEWAKTQGPLEMAYDPGLVRSPEGERPGAVPASAGPEPSSGSMDEGDPRHYGALVDRIRALVDEELPAGATIAVVSRGDYRLMHLGGRQVWHFPRAENGLYAGYHPRTSGDAIEHLESLRGAGADFLVFPATALWWLDYYEEFRGHLDEKYRRVVDDPGTCIAFELERRSVNGTGRAVVLGRRA